MRTTKIIVRQKHGIHARVAAAIAGMAQALTSRLTFKKDNQAAEGTSVIQLLMLAAQEGAEIEVTADGGNEELSMKAVTEFFSEGSGI